MYCSNCGNEIENTAKFCPYCGQPVQQPNSGINNIPNDRTYNASNNVSYNPPYTASPVNEYNNQYRAAIVPEIQQGMKWYKFIIYFQLFLAMISALGSGVTYFTGSQYGGNAPLVYAFYGNGLRTLDIFMGITQFALIPLLIYVRQQLKNFKRNAPMLYIVTLSIEFVVILFYVIVAGVIIDASVITSMVSVSIFTNLLMIAINFIYFKKREHLFVH